MESGISFANIIVIWIFLLKINQLKKIKINKNKNQSTEKYQAINSISDMTKNHKNGMRMILNDEMLQDRFWSQIHIEFKYNL